MPDQFLVIDVVGTVNIGSCLYLTTHSKQRVEDRNIPDPDIISTFLFPDQKSQNRDYSNAHDYEKSIQGRKLKLCIKDDEAPFILITAFYR